MSNRLVPAAAAGLPSTPEVQLSPFQGYEHAFKYLEPLVFRAANFARLQATLAEIHDEDRTPEFRAQTVETMSFIAGETQAAVEALETHWMHAHNGGARQAFRDLLNEPEATVPVVIAAHRLALALNDKAHAAHERPRDGLSPEEVAAILRASDERHDEERAAWATFLTIPCRSAADVQAKLAYVVDDQRLLGFFSSPVEDPAFLQSLRIVEAGR